MWSPASADYPREHGVTMATPCIISVIHIRLLQLDITFDTLKGISQKPMVVSAQY